MQSTTWTILADRPCACAVHSSILARHGSLRLITSVPTHLYPWHIHAKTALLTSASEIVHMEKSSSHVITKIFWVTSVTRCSRYLQRVWRVWVVILGYPPVVYPSSIGRASLARENEAGAVGGRRSIYSMLTYRTMFCFGHNNRTVPK